MCLPLSTKKKMKRFQSEITYDKVSGFALLDQVRVIDSKRLLRKIGTVSESQFENMKTKLKKLL